MSDRQTVRRRYSRAYLDWYGDYDDPYTVVSTWTGNARFIGTGRTEAEAWSRAAVTVREEKATSESRS